MRVSAGIPGHAPRTPLANPHFGIRSFLNSHSLQTAVAGRYIAFNE